MKTIKMNASLLIILLATLSYSCSVPNSNSPNSEKNEYVMPDFTKAICVLYPTEGYDAMGTVEFTQTDSGMVVSIKLKGLSPGKHGFHIHQYGDCSAPNGTSAGGHYNPENEPHGAPTDFKRHIGDLGNVTANENGEVVKTVLDPKLTFYGKNSIIGRGIIVHKDEDDLKTQPTGNAGPRIACGVIGVRK